MSLSRREVILASATSAVVLGLVTWLIASPMLKTIDLARTQQAKLQTERNALDKLINQRSSTIGQLESLRAQLPRFRPDEQVSAQIVSSVKKIADEQQLTITRIDPDLEKPIGDLSEIAIDCAWEGSLESITHFLHAVQAQGAMLDIRQLSVQPQQNTTQSGRLRGNFKVFYAFMRVKPEPPKPAPVAASTNAPSTNAAVAAVEAAAPVLKVVTNVPAAAVTNAAAVATNAPAAKPAAVPPMPSVR